MDGDCFNEVGVIVDVEAERDEDDEGPRWLSLSSVVDCQLPDLMRGGGEAEEKAIQRMTEQASQ